MADLFDIAIARKLSGGGGGGGLNVPTARVTFISSAATYYINGIPAVENEKLVMVMEQAVSAGSPITFDIPLYAVGSETMYLIGQSAFSYIDGGVMPVLTGGIEFSSSGFVVRGDGTITIKGMAQ